MSQAATVASILIEADPKKAKDFLRRAGVTSSYTLTKTGWSSEGPHDVRDAETRTWIGTICGGQHNSHRGVNYLKPNQWVITNGFTGLSSCSQESYQKFFNTREEAAAHLWHRWYNAPKWSRSVNHPNKK